MTNCFIEKCQKFLAIDDTYSVYVYEMIFGKNFKIVYEQNGSRRKAHKLECVLPFLASYQDDSYITIMVLITTEKSF